MTLDLAEILVCPSCRKSELQLSTSTNPGTASRIGTAVPVPDSDGATELLTCRCGAVYPLVDGVPRLFDGAIECFLESGRRHQAQVEAHRKHEDLVDTSASRKNGADDYDSIRKSFSKEWSAFDYHHDKTWGWSIAERKEVFLNDIQMQPSELAGKRLLDAGCGNGTLSAALTDFGLSVVGLDLNDGLGTAYANRSKYGAAAKDRVQYVQGNLVQPPFKEGSYDIVYSSGVIHHTPSSKKSFGSLSRMPRPGGRLYVWVYRKRALPVRLFFTAGRSLKKFISLQSLMAVCKTLAPGYKFAVTVLHGLNVAQFRSRSNREITLDLFDAFAPRYNHWHTEAEVRSWFEENGFKNITLSGVQKHGFGMFGDKV